MRALSLGICFTTYIIVCETEQKSLRILLPSKALISHISSDLQTMDDAMRELFASNQPEKYAGLTSYFGGEAPLSQALGYMVVLGFGAPFSILTTSIVYLERKMTGKEINSENFK